MQPALTSWFVDLTILAPGAPVQGGRQAGLASRLGCLEEKGTCAVLGSSALAGVLRFLVYLLKIVIVVFLFLFFCPVKASVFAEEMGRSFQLK